MSVGLEWNLPLAQTFLDTLGQSNHRERFVFQTFSDCKAENGGALAQVLTGTLPELQDRLISLNRAGAGVFVGVNRFDGTGKRRASNVVGLRAFFADMDGGALPPLPIQASMLVQSKRGEHAYWVLNPGESCERFPSVQKAISRALGSDPKVHDLPRVMRIPGFYHLKNPSDPFMVGLSHVSPTTYSLDEITAAFSEGPSRDHGDGEDRGGFLAWARALPTAEAGANPFGGRNPTALLLIREGLARGLPITALSGSLLGYCERSGLPESEAREMLARQERQHGESPFRAMFTNPKNESPVAADLAEELLRSRGLIDHEHLRVRCWRGDFYSYTGSKYQALPAFDLRPDVVRFLREKPETRRRAGTRLSNEIIANLEAIASIPSGTQLPMFLSQGPGSGVNTIAVSNGILDVDRCVRGVEGAFVPHTADYFSTACLPFHYQPEAECPRWTAFLNEMVPDPEMRELLQEWFGYNLIFDTSQQKLLLLLGDGANGKTVICTVLRALLGAQNVSAVALEQFNPERTFPLAATLGKLANIVEEVGETKIAGEKLVKEFVDGGMITIERKNRDAFEMVPTARLTFASNTMPHFKDKTDAIWRRLMILPLGEQILDESKQDKRLATPAFWGEAGELPGVFNWAVLGLRRLRAAGRFTAPERSLAARQDFREEANPAKTFLDDYCVARAGAELSGTELYRHYGQCIKARGALPLGDGKFAQEVKRRFPDARKTEHPQRQPDGSRCRNWIGIAWTDGQPPPVHF